MKRPQTQQENFEYFKKTGKFITGIVINDDGSTFLAIIDDDGQYVYKFIDKDIRKDNWTVWTRIIKNGVEYELEYVNHPQGKYIPEPFYSDINSLII